jgi:hypothetical protein
MGPVVTSADKEQREALVLVVIVGCGETGNSMSVFSVNKVAVGAGPVVNPGEAWGVGSSSEFLWAC